MAKPREHLRNAPIVEAAIDIRVPPGPAVNASAFSGINASIGAKYSVAELIKELQARIGIERGSVLEPAQTQTDLGWMYRAGSEIAQFRTNGFTFSKVSPYTTWEDVFGEALRLWKVYKSIAKPAQLSRIAVRFINRMQVRRNEGVGDYLVAPPIVPPPVSSVIREFLTRLHIEDPKRKAAAILITALEPQIDQDVMSLFLDVDAYHEGTLEPDDPSLSQIFQRLRELKNEVFYASLTEKAVEKFQ